jgi:LacI family transcriptional regulator
VGELRVNKRLSLEDIARKAGVSRSTVSRVINHDPNVHEKTRERVQKVIQENHFTPNPSARALVTQRTRILGVVIPHEPTTVFLDEAFYFPLLLEGVAEAASERDYGVLLWLGRPDEDRDAFYGRIIQNRWMDGLILASSPNADPLVERLLHANQPFVQVERTFNNHNQVSYVTVDNVKAAQAIVDHLINQGRRRIAIITGDLIVPDAIDRLEGYKLALRSAGLPIDESLIYIGQFNRRSGYLGMKALVNQNIDAVFTSMDAMAAGAMEVLHNAGLRIPDDVAVVGFDDLPIAQRLSPPLTTIRQPIRQKGARAADLLIDLVEGAVEGPQQILLPTQLVIRESCGALVQSYK